MFPSHAMMAEWMLIPKAGRCFSCYLPQRVLGRGDVYQQQDLAVTLCTAALGFKMQTGVLLEDLASQIIFSILYIRAAWKHSGTVINPAQVKQNSLQLHRTWVWGLLCASSSQQLYQNMVTFFVKWVSAK